MLKALADILRGLPPVYYSGISKDLIRACVGKPNPTILEIGCNDGEHTRWFLDAFESPVIYCFEPDPRAAMRFREKLGDRDNVHLFELALSDHDGEAIFFQSSGHRSQEDSISMPDGWDRSGSIRRPKQHLVTHPWIRFDRTIAVKTRTLDSWHLENGVREIDFIWMDVQGAELDVLRGGKDALSKTRFLYTEYRNIELYVGQPSLKSLIRHLREFQILVRYRGDILLQNKHVH